MGFEPTTPWLQTRCSPSWATAPTWLPKIAKGSRSVTLGKEALHLAQPLAGVLHLARVRRRGQRNELRVVRDGERVLPLPFAQVRQREIGLHEIRVRVDRLLKLLHSLLETLARQQEHAVHVSDVGPVGRELRRQIVFLQRGGRVARG